MFEEQVFTYNEAKKTFGFAYSVVKNSDYYKHCLDENKLCSPFKIETILKYTKNDDETYDDLDEALKVAIDKTTDYFDKISEYVLKEQKFYRSLIASFPLLPFFKKYKEVMNSLKKELVQAESFKNSNYKEAYVFIEKPEHFLVRKGFDEDQILYLLDGDIRGQDRNYISRTGKDGKPRVITVKPILSYFRRHISDCYSPIYKLKAIDIEPHLAQSVNHKYSLSRTQINTSYLNVSAEDLEDGIVATFSETRTLFLSKEAMVKELNRISDNALRIHEETQKIINSL